MAEREIQMSRKFAALATVGLVALAAGPALPAPGGKNSEIEDLKNRVTVLEGTVSTLQGQVNTNTANFGVLDQTVSDILLSLTGIQDQLNSLDGRLTTVEQEVLTPLFDIVVRSSTHTADPGGVFIYQDCLDGEMALGGLVVDPDVGFTWVVDAQGFHWAGDGDWATGWAANVTGGSGEDVQIGAVCATALVGLPDFGENPLQN
jgi:hypothetical protein